MAAVAPTRASALRRSLGVPLGPHPRRALPLAPLTLRVDAVQDDALLRLGGERVHSDDDAGARFDAGLEPEGGLLDLTLDEPGLDRGDRAAELVDPLDQRRAPEPRARR